ncbi:LysR family transcriptional regulator [Acidomonas methanolica]|uniref:Transcriptional regulator LysR n=1 Tax=Acidomonas methanolica NBRC 104435 TaxID=1231351 RepID=A0A023D8K9_ACIMT|nr:LysR family transcriptional regulator [Acidomonas methanolica]MBU2652914.1 LysR family transcriptional regulator [Acidomonas methanolica]TCS31317.1 DNA-binding transcriptional LysR family regulator [Acidomonas methanolica]GAJ30439.1 transcriptional regulator LysR [Acidomonas methanolica NBRC 104435]GBQ52594.1 LysR family transcriptional regulator [Acidomonas methanolica]GEK98434.1 LysR family transcriptional regulator [Acidomonas methanolica NBRC 104435]
MPLPDFEAWAIFARVAEFGSFARAADALHLSKPTVSKAVARLELSLAGSLFNRTSRKLSLTEFGREALAHANRILSAGENAEAELRDTVRRPQGLIRVAAPMSFGITHLAPVLPRFLQDFPEISVNVQFSDALVDLVADGYDLAVRIASLPDSSLRSRRLCTIPLLLVAAPELLLREGAPDHPRDLAGFDAAIYTNSRDIGAITLRHRGGEEFIWRQRGRLSANNAEGLLPALRAGLGIGVVPAFLGEEDLRAGRLVRVLDGWEAGPVSLHLVTPPSPLRPARVSALMAYLADQFKSSPWSREGDEG